MSSNLKNIVIVANSARMLAQSASKSGIRALVIDCFADFETQEMALESIKVDNLAVANVSVAISLLNKQYSIAYVVYGSGLECYQDTLKYLEQKFIVLGNSFDVFSLVQNKYSFFLRLNKLDIPYPEISFQAPKQKTDWLIKPLQGEGGIGIKRYAGDSNANGAFFWQQFCQGTPSSVLFIANETEYQIIGFHKQYVTQINEDEFVFSGLINQPKMNEVIVHQLNEMLQKLVPEFSLKGFNSVDFIVNDNKCYVLEINARPSASLNLYDFDFFSAQINSCLGKGLLNSVGFLKAYQAYQIIFAETDIIINKHLIWPSWVSDIPWEDSIINTGMPICSIIAGGKNEQQVEDLLLVRQKQLKNFLT